MSSARQPPPGTILRHIPAERFGVYDMPERWTVGYWDEELPEAWHVVSEAKTASEALEKAWSNKLALEALGIRQAERERAGSTNAPERAPQPRCFRCDQTIRKMPLSSHRCPHGAKCETDSDHLPRCVQCKAFKSRQTTQFQEPTTMPDQQAERPKRGRKPKANGNGKPNQVMVRALKKSLRCNLDAAGLAERSDRAAHVLAERDALDEEAKAASKQAKARVAEKEAELRKLSAQIRDRAEYREVACEERHDYRVGRVYVVRLDTNEVIDERAMTAAERQTELPLPDKKAGASDAGDDDGEQRAPDEAPPKKPRGRKPRAAATEAAPAE